jgi:hypothetical protein
VAWEGQAVTVTGIFFSQTFMGAPTEGGAMPEHNCFLPAGSSVVKFTKHLEKVKQQEKIE